MYENHFSIYFNKTFFICRVLNVLLNYLKYLIKNIHVLIQLYVI